MPYNKWLHLKIAAFLDKESLPYEVLVKLNMLYFQISFWPSKVGLHCKVAK